MHYVTFVLLWLVLVLQEGKGKKGEEARRSIGGESEGEEIQLRTGRKVKGKLRRGR